ncbi:MAG: class I SAM-dependent methyltransferase [Pseudomonadota bacterium]
MDEAREARFWDRMARRYAKSAIGDEAGYERTLERTASLLGADHEVLELGCGTGPTALRLAGAAGSYLATDLSPGMIEIANERLAAEPTPGLRFEAATAATVAAPTGGFDAALGFNYLHLVDDLPATLVRIHALLAPGGLLVTKTPCLSEMTPLIRLLLPLMRLVRMAPGTVLFFTETELRQRLETAGFAIETVERHGTKGKDTRPWIVARRI